MKKIVILVFVLLIVLGLVACNPIEDTNGADDTSLCQITKEELIGNSSRWSTTKSVTKTRRNSSSHSSSIDINDDIDYDYLSFKTGSSSGTTTMVGVKLHEDETVRVSVETSIDEGNLAVVLVKKNSDGNELIYQFQNDSQDAYTITADEDAAYLVKVGAESFGGKIVITREYLE